MVVDDDEFSRRTACRILKRLGASRIVEASDGSEALRKVDPTAPVDVILCDLRMPGTDGIETLRSLADHNVSALVVLVSGADPRVLRSARHMAAGFGIRRVLTLAKPLTVDSMGEALTTVATPDFSRGEPRIRSEPPEPTEAKIRAGLEADEFSPWFQPKIDLASGRVVGAEALVRWRPVDGEVVAPGRFLPVVLASNLMDELTEAVLCKAAAACALWERLGHDLTVSVNLHVSSLAERDLPRRLENLAHASGIASERVVFEITEDGWLHRAAGETLTRLRLRGFGLSIDDFGTGYSTLQQLLEAPFNELKIDQSFVRSAPEDEEAAAALASSVTLARRLGLSVVGEGIETDAQRHFLEEAGCDVGQGYALARPMSGADFADWLTLREAGASVAVLPGG